MLIEKNSKFEILNILFECEKIENMFYKVDEILMLLNSLKQSMYLKM
jgi:hypothetical protein